MALIPKHEVTTPAPRKGNKKPPQPAVAAVAAAPDPNLGLGDVAVALNRIAGLYANHQRRMDMGENGLSISTSSFDDPVKVQLESGDNPVKLTFADNIEDDAMDRLITAFERIADSIAKLAGLNRPRLESWHEQDEYEPRYKGVACDGGAPGPKTKAS